MPGNMGGGGIGIGMTGPGVLKEFRAIKGQIGQNVPRSPGVSGRELENERNPQFPRSMTNGNKWALAMKKRMEKRQLGRPEPTDGTGVRSRPANKRPNTGAVDQNYSNSGAITESRRSSNQSGRDAGAGPK